MSDPSLAVAVRAARNAAAVIADAAQDLKRLPASSREHGEIVKAADKEAENAIASTISAAFPEHSIVGRDRPADAGSPGRSWRWIVDAIDGTANFAHGYPHYAVSIALAHGPEITHAVVLDPLRDELFTAAKSRGAHLNGVALRVSACTSLERALLGTVVPAHGSRKLAPYLPVFGALARSCAGIRRGGACALDLAFLAAGRLDGFWVMSLKPWDVAAGALLVREAGGRVGDFAGGDDFLRGEEIIAAAPGVFNALREAIAGAIA
jgi:myo-inositol-1(or 4)-monophosphatase